MMVRAVLLACSLILLGVAAAPTAAASDCIAGTNANGCAVAVRYVECVQEPCDTLTVCVGYGRVCAPV